MAWLGNLFICSILCIFTCNAYVIDDANGIGRRFDGIGGISGGGATSKLLISYPQKQRDEILDYLFKPNYGASLHILKVEIGGDSQSTDGTESSHMHEPWDENYQRGYEWWLINEAKKRNPGVLLYGLPWAFPGWVSGGSGNPYSQPNVTADYVVRWVSAAKRVYGHAVDYIGIWNERNYDVTYVKTLRASLDAAGFGSVQIVAADGGWGIVGDIQKDADFAKAVDFIGVHYPGTTSTPPAVATGKQLWASEDYSTFNDNVGAGCWARILNQNYVNGHMTATISWNLIASYYQSLPFGRDGLMTAQEPWSGHYVVEAPIWVTAHTSQFVSVGWRYLQHGAGVGHLDNGGSYVSLSNADGTQLTLVLETMSHDHSKCIRPGLPAYNVTAQTATFTLKGSFSGVKELNVWRSKLGFDNVPTEMFVKQDTLMVNNGSFSLSLGVDEIVTLTTMTSGQKGDAGSPPVPAAFPLPYKDDFESYAEYSEAAYFAPQVGVWEVRKSADRGMVNRQVVLNQPVDWCRNTVPVNIGGNHVWSNVYVQADVRVPAVNGSDSAFVAARVAGGGCGADRSKGLYLHLNVTGASFVLATDPAGSQFVVRGKADVKFDTWYSLTLMLRDTQAIGFLDQRQLFVTTVPADPNNGFVGYGTNRFGLADFDKFLVEDDSFLMNSFRAVEDLVEPYDIL